MLPRDNGCGIPEAQVPKATRPAPDPANPRNFGGSKREERRSKKKRSIKKGDRIEKRIKGINHNQVGGKGVVTELHQCPLGTQRCDRNSGEPGPVCPAVGRRRQLLFWLARVVERSTSCRKSGSAGDRNWFVRDLLLSGVLNSPCCSSDHCTYLGLPSSPFSSEQPRLQSYYEPCWKSLDFCLIRAIVLNATLQQILNGGV